MKSLTSSVVVLAASLCTIAAAVVPASLAFSSTSPVPAVLTCAGKKAVQPTSYVLACADANTYFNSVHWTSWTSRSAEATATLVQNNCTPTCAAGRFVKYPATLTLSQPKSTRLGLLFSVIHYSYTVSESTTLPLTTLSSVH
jgi:hypothetical protein